MDVVIIPAFEPDKILVSLVKEIKKENYIIVVVDDGSGDQYKHIFDEIKEDVYLLVHEKNKGKGEGIKTALSFIEENIPKGETIVTIDADGQHKISDMKKVLDKARYLKNSLVTGKRTFSKDIPAKSRFGNNLTKFVFKLVSGVKMEDTQTGLRGFSRSLIPELKKIEGSRYEYELNMFLFCTRNKIEIVEVPIETVYHDKNNSCSHFRGVRDSIIIYKEIFKFAASSLMSFVLDYMIFIILSLIFLDKVLYIIFANVIARLISGTFNYTLNEKFVFKNKNERGKKILQYIILAMIILLLNNFVLVFYNFILPFSLPIVKIFTEVTLFLFSFLIQSKIIFAKKRLIQTQENFKEKVYDRN